MPIAETALLIGLITSLAGGIGAAIFIAYLVISKIVKWFRDRSKLKQQDQDNIAFTLQDKLKNGQYKTVQGVFNTRTNDLEDARIIKSDKIDSDLSRMHKNDQLVVFE
ncbi:MAG: hypothetical protein AAGE84_21560 [Cyanobacteria bacterium P01_G01_bin.39]